jgi:hypothetical protein
VIADSNGVITDAGIKSIYSDAFKRAAVQFGVGAFLYSLPRQYAAADQLKQLGRSWYLTPALENTLRGSYAKWLKDTGIKDFGEPLDHGSVASDATDDVETPAPAAPPIGRTYAVQPANMGIPLDQVRALRSAVIDAGATPEEVGLLLVTVGVQYALAADYLAAESMTLAEAKATATLLTDEQASAVLDALRTAARKDHYNGEPEPAENGGTDGSERARHPGHTARSRRGEASEGARDDLHRPDQAPERSGLVAHARRHR